jgi:glycosyltransferase involved in cell wall biosynthesis
MDLNLMAPVNSLGYGVVSLNLLKALFKENVNVALWPIGQIEIHEEDREVVQTAINNSKLFNPEAHSLRIFHQFDMGPRIGHGPALGYCFFESDVLNDVEIHNLSSLDKILVPSHWAKKVVVKHLVESKKTSKDYAGEGNEYWDREYSRNRVFVLQAGVDNSIFYHDPEIQNEIAASPATKFLNIGKWEIRKGHDVLLEAFNTAFSENDDVLLLMTNYNPFISEQENHNWAKLYKNSKLGNKIHIFPRMNSQEKVSALMQSVDCGVFPSRAEGWNLELLEMMACGKPVISTFYSGHTEFANRENAFLIEPEEFEPAYDGVFFFGDGQWMKFTDGNFNELVKYMQTIHSNKKSQGSLINIPGMETAKQFSWQNSARRLISILGEV